MNDVINSLPALPGVTPAEGETPENKQALKYAATATDPKFVAREQFSAETQAALKQYALDLFNGSEFTVTGFIQLVQEYDIDALPIMDGMLDNIKVRDAGELGERMLDTTKKIRRVHKEMPEIDLAIDEMIRKGQLFGKKLIRYVDGFTSQLKRALDRYKSVLDVVNENVDFLEKRYARMLEDVVTTEKLSEEANERTEKLLTLAAVLEYLKDIVSERQKELVTLLEAASEDDASKSELEEEQKHLNSMSPLVITRLGALIPMIHMSSMNQDRFMQQSVTAASIALKLSDILSVEIPQWKTDIGTSLLAMFQQVELVTISSTGGVFDEEADKANENYVSSVQSTADMLATWMEQVSQFHDRQEAIITAGKEWAEGLKDAAKAANQAAREVKKGRDKVEKKQTEMSRELANLANQA